MRALFLFFTWFYAALALAALAWAALSFSWSVAGYSLVLAFMFGCISRVFHWTFKELPK